MRRNRNGVILALVLLGLVCGCKKEEKAPPAPKPPEPAAPAAPAAPVQKQLSSVTRPGGGLDFSKRTDPFKAAVAPPPPAAVKGNGQAVATPSGDVLPIQSFEVGKFKVAGIIAGIRENRALLIDPNGKGYVVQTGMEIGNAGGRISRITASTVEVVERYKSGGRTKSRTIVLTLAKKR